jgi:hypothetical protein
MGHYARVVDDRVVQVIPTPTGIPMTDADPAQGEWIKTSYNTLANVHSAGKSPLRGNYAGIGFLYDRQNDVFISPCNFPSWTLNTDSWTWQAPVPYPADAGLYAWDEPTLSWIEIILPD